MEIIQSLSFRRAIHSDNLELVTIIECVSAAGDSVPPSFIFADGPINAGYWNIEDIGGSVPKKVQCQLC